MSRSNGEYVLSDFNAKGLVERGTGVVDVCFEGFSMVDMKTAMVMDAEAQKCMIQALMETLDEMVVLNDKSQSNPQKNCFTGQLIKLKASEYVKRIMKYGGLSECCLIVAAIYLDRLKEVDPSVCLTALTLQRMLLVTVMSAAKFFDDMYYSNKRWAEIGGIPLAELNKLELDFLFLIGFRLNVKRSEYDGFAAHLLHRHPALPIPHASAAPSGSSDIAMQGRSSEQQQPAAKQDSALPQAGPSHTVVYATGAACSGICLKAATSSPPPPPPPRQPPPGPSAIFV